MKRQLRRVGKSRSPIVAIDEFSSSVEEASRLAGPPSQAFGGRSARPTNSPIPMVCYQHRAAPFIGGGFEVDGFDLMEASFSILTTQPGELQTIQRAQHFDSSEQNIFALLHYVNVPENSGTNLYRHRATGIERVMKDRVVLFVTKAKTEASMPAADSGYMRGSDPSISKSQKSKPCPTA